MMPRRDLHLPSYEQGYRDGENSAHSDYQFALTESSVWPIGREVTPASVAQFIDQLGKETSRGDA